jgi:hypothetical protein
MSKAGRERNPLQRAATQATFAAAGIEKGAQRNQTATSDFGHFLAEGPNPRISAHIPAYRRCSRWSAA